MDLVALAGFKTLMIHRLDVQTPPKKSTWERICAIETPAVISCLAWHPDGIAVACGLEDGRVSVWEIDSWKELSAKSSQVHQAKINAIQWTKHDVPKGAEKGRDLISALFHYNYESSDAGDAFDINDSVLNIMAVADDRGLISFYAYGIFFLGMVHSSEILKKIDRDLDVESISISSCSLCARLRAVSIVADLKLSSSAESKIFLAFDMPLYADCRNQIKEASWKISEIDLFHEKINQCVLDMKKEWNKIDSSFKKYFDSLRERTKAEKFDTTIEQLFFTFFISGVVTETLHQYLLFQLKPRDLKEWMKLVDNAMEEMQDTLSNKCQLYAEKLFHLVSELKSFSNERPEVNEIGLDKERAEQCLQLCASLCISIESFINTLLVKRVQFSNFFNWLLKVQSYLLEDQKSSQPQPQYNSTSVMQLLQEGLHAESIEKYFSDIGEFNLRKPPTRTNVREGPAYPNEFQPSAVSKFFFFKSQESKSLPSILSEYSTHVSAIKENISKNLMSAAQNAIYIELSQATNALCRFYSPPTEFERIALYFRKPSKLCVLSFSAQSKSDAIVKGISLSDESSLVDYSWCDHNKLILLLKESKGYLMKLVSLEDLQEERSIALEEFAGTNLLTLLQESHETDASFPENTKVLEIPNFEPISISSSPTMPPGICSVLSKTKRQTIIYDLQVLEESESNDTEQAENPSSEEV